MLRLPVFLSLVAIGAYSLALSGCGGQETPPAGEGSQESAAMEHEHAGDEHGHEEQPGAGGPVVDPGQYEGALAQLSPEDRSLAEKQKTCPVSGQPLGSMGKPYKVTVKGQDVLLCCQGCESEIKENPEKYLAKLNQ